MRKRIAILGVILIMGCTAAYMKVQKDMGSVQSSAEESKFSILPISVVSGRLSENPDSLVPRA